MNESHFKQIIAFTINLTIWTYSCCKKGLEGLFIAPTNLKSKSKYDEEIFTQFQASNLYLTIEVANHVKICHLIINIYLLLCIP